MPSLIPGMPGVNFEDPGNITSSIKRQVDQVLGIVPPGKRTAMVAVLTENGVNAAFAIRNKKGTLEVKGWIGKYWTEPVAGGVMLSGSWE